MDANQKLTDLKKAYADVILHATTEAAGRILASERRAARLELELKQLKENSLHMLLRQKHVMDSKMSEAEMALRDKQKKIEALEAIVQEAEGMVKGLSEELILVRAELERVQPRKEVGKSHHQDLPSLILRSKGSKLYQSGSTRRIRACRRTQVEREFPLPKPTNHIKPDLISLGDERRKCRKRTNSNRKKRTSLPNGPWDQVKEMDHVAVNSHLTTKRLVKSSTGEKPDTSIDSDKGLVSLWVGSSSIREELQSAYPSQEEQLEIGNSDKDQNKKGKRLHNSLFPFGKSHHQDLPSTITRSKGSKLNRIKPDLISPGDERRKCGKRTIANRKKRTSLSNRLLDEVKEMDHVTVNSHLTTKRVVKSSTRKKPNASIDSDRDLVSVWVVFSRIREELHIVGWGKPESLPNSEAKDDTPESMALRTGDFPIEPKSCRAVKHTYQRKRKRKTLSSDVSGLRSAKRNKENKTARSKTEKVISVEESKRELEKRWMEMLC